MVAIATTPLPAQLIVCLGPDVPGISAEVTFAPAVKALQTEQIGQGMVKVDLTLSFVLRLTQTNSGSDQLPAVDLAPTTPRISVHPLVGAEIPTYGDGSTTGSPNEALAFKDYTAMNGCQPPSRDTLAVWISLNREEKNTFKDYIQSVGCSPQSRETLLQWGTFMKRRLPTGPKA